ncbi:3D domain-containing protein [Patescibacteria group bacterium]|nr:3D domain-containing protein [Patescibacteria group bacterium]
MAVVFSLVFNVGMPHISLAAHENYMALSHGEKMPYEYSILAPQPAVDSYNMITSREERLISQESLNSKQEAFLSLEGEPSVVAEHWITVTAYSSESRQTDDTPFTTAWQTPVRDGVVALNFLPKGTLIRFPDKYGDKIFIVEDRMNVRYPYRADIWMYTREEAKQFGIKYLRMEQLNVCVPRDYVFNHYEAAFPGLR